MKIIEKKATNGISIMNGKKAGINAWKAEDFTFHRATIRYFIDTNSKWIIDTENMKRKKVIY